MPDNDDRNETGCGRHVPSIVDSISISILALMLMALLSISCCFFAVTGGDMVFGIYPLVSIEYRAIEKTENRTICEGDFFACKNVDRNRTDLEYRLNVTVTWIEMKCYRSAIEGNAYSEEFEKNYYAYAECMNHVHYQQFNFFIWFHVSLYHRFTGYWGVPERYFSGSLQYVR